MTASYFEKTGIYVASCALAIVAALAPSWAQSAEPVRGVAPLGTVQGHVHDSSGKPVANAVVFLQPATGSQLDASVSMHTDSEGRFSFAPGDGTFTVRAEMNGVGQAIFGPVVLTNNETKTIDLTLRSSGIRVTALPSPKIAEKPGAPAPEFYDEPQFTVAGVAQASNSGGHGSDTVLRTTEALARATVSLGKEPEPAPQSPAATEISLRNEVARYPKDPALHHQLGEVEEKLGNPLGAVREYQRAAELDPSEQYLFDWGTELLAHRALEPAVEVFTKGNRLFPSSMRMLVALGVADYARGSYDEAAHCLANASDIDPRDPTPYLFLGSMQDAEIIPSEGTVDRLARFVELQPENPLASYYYAVGLLKESGKEAGKESLSPAGGEHDEQPRVQPENGDARSLFVRVESLLQKAVKLDPRLGVAYLQLGKLYSQRGDLSRAIPAYEKAIAVISEQARPLPLNRLLDNSRISHPSILYPEIIIHPQIEEALEESHYRLAQAYLRVGEKVRAQEQLQLHQELSKKTKENSEQEQRDIQEFVISLRNNNPPAQ